MRWGLKSLDDDTPLAEPKLIAFRYKGARVEALYQTIENPVWWGRGFVIDDLGHFSGEHGLLTLTNSPYCPWKLLAERRDPNDGALKPIAEMAPLHARDARALRELGVFVHPDRKIIPG